ncbi:hypothetical protein C8T65DRAFT_767687 [Cerioporus squamosus]|nr:hypothetical protein C8T65DRAFT_767687 [Cerioporus squamosus]
MSTPSVTVVAQDAVEALTLFRRIDRPDMLPAALYACCQWDLGRLIRGVRRADGAFVEKLDLDDLERCLKARRELKESNVKLALNLFSGSPDEYYFIADANILGPYFSEYIESYLGDDPAFCRGGCAQMLKDTELARRLAAWRSPPGHVGVHTEGWGRS